MKKALYVILGSLTLLFACEDANEKTTLDNEIDSLSYGIGISIAKSIKQQLSSAQIDTLVNNKAVILGFNEYFDTSAVFSIQPEEAEAVVDVFFKRKQDEDRQIYLAGFQNNMVAGQKFLEENKTKEGIQVLPNGVQYKEIKRGWGESPQANDTVRVHYHGTLIDGTVFDSSVERGEPVEFPVAGVIPGFSSALQNMKTGSKWIIYIPQDLAYGEDVKPGGAIKPYSTLIFEVELQRIVSKKKKRAVVAPAQTKPVATQSQPAATTEPVKANPETTKVETQTAPVAE